MTASTTEQERAEFEAWYIARARKAVPAFAEWSEIEILEGCMRPDSGSYRIDSARIAWDAWQAARRAPLVPVPQGYRLQPLSEYDAMCEFISAAPQPPEAALVPSIAVTPEMVEAANEAYCPFGDMELALCAALQVAPIPPEAAPVQLPEYGIDTANHAGIRVRGYTEQQVRRLLAAHGIQEQST